MRFLADENVSRHVVERLRGAGFDVAAIGSMVRLLAFGRPSLPRV